MFWWITAALCAYFVKGLCGFANTLVFSTILSFTNSNVSISPTDLLLGFPGNLMVVWKERRSICWRVCLPVAALVLAGSIPGALLLKNTDTGVIKIIFGAVIILIGLEMMLREFQTKKIKPSKILLAIIGILSGILCGLYGIGALLGAYMSRVTEDSSSFKANLCVVFLADNAFRILLYTLWGIFTPDIVRQALILLPFMVIGLLLGMISCKVISEKIIRRLVVILLILSGIALIANSL